MLQGWSHLLCHPNPVSAPLPAQLLVQPGWRLSSPCAGLADTSPFSVEQCNDGLCSTSPSLHSHPGLLGRTPSVAGPPQPWCGQAAAGFIPIHPALQHCVSYRPTELLIRTVPKPLPAARRPQLCHWSCWERPGVAREHFPAGARAAGPLLTQSETDEVP